MTGPKRAIRWSAVAAGSCMTSPGDDRQPEVPIAQAELALLWPTPALHEPPCGQAFAARNPAHGSYHPFAWDSQVGPKLTPNVPAA